MSCVVNRFIVTLLCFCQLGEQLGTTPNIKDIVFGRCYDYMTLNPGTRYDCEGIWLHFEAVVLRQPSCNVTVEDYHKMFQLMTQNWPCHTSLFWSKTRALVHSYSAVLPHLWTLEDTLVGYMFNDLIWCRQHVDTDFNFSACPEWSSCQNHPVYSLWLLASQNFAETACGNITVLLNGSISAAFNRMSMFGSVELANLSPQRVHYVNIHVVTSLMGPQIESCSQGSVVDLIQILQTRGFRWTCTDNDQDILDLQDKGEAVGPSGMFHSMETNMWLYQAKLQVRSVERRPRSQMLMMLQCFQNQDSCRTTNLKSVLFTQLN